MEGCNVRSKVLVLGNDTRSFLAVIRSLGRKNIEVHVGWFGNEFIAIKSKYISKIHYIPTFSLQSDDWLLGLMNIIKVEKFDLIIPCNDQSIIPLQGIRTKIEAYSAVYLLDEKCYSIANDKFIMQALATKLGVNVANEVRITKSISSTELIHQLGLPVVIKPQASYSRWQVGEKQNVFKVYNSKDLDLFLSREGIDGNYAAQSNFIGQGVGVEILVQNGRILVAFQHGRIHEPLNGGGSSYRKSMVVNPALLKASELIVNAIDYTGVAMVEFKFNNKTRDWIFIELNARFWGSLPLPVSCGVDFPYFLFQMLVKGENDFSVDYKSNIYCRNTTNDLTWLISNIRADHSDSNLATRTHISVISEICHLFSLREKNDTLVLDDMKPGLCELAYVIKKYLLAIREKVINKWYHSVTYRHYAKRRATFRLKKSKTVLFICKGNICRSPFAYYYLKQKKPNLLVESCGYIPKSKRTSPNVAVEAAREFDIDMSSHLSKVVTEKNIDDADIIFVFDVENMHIVSSNYPKCQDKIFFLSSLETGSEFPINDPYSKTTAEFVKTYETIACLLSSIK